MRRAIRRFGADQAVVAIVMVAGDDLAGLAAFFFDQVAGGVVGVVAVAHHQRGSGCGLGADRPVRAVCRPNQDEAF
ncbi:hypothetical protein QZJ86_01860 [Methylomonas montana]|uniref:hypothetical protein n=1 Tax=Methylomonas montana TaxID=3058963 RepID=UPI0026587F95|nr:hypothetical protein [Methylomonas montana]WKJ92709.1 hypothetical protein QZJ86_01860 [Methylomonas montana]